MLIFRSISDFVFRPFLKMGMVSGVDTRICLKGKFFAQREACVALERTILRPFLKMGMVSGVDTRICPKGKFFAQREACVALERTILRPFLKMGMLLIVTLLLAQNSYGFGIFFGGDDEEQSKVLTATQEVLDNVATYKAEADIYFKEKNIEAVLEKYQKLYALIEMYDLEEERLSYHLYLTKINHYQHDNLSLLSNLNAAMLIALELEDDKKLAYIYSRMGYVHYDEFNYFLAKSLVTQAGEMYAEDGNDKALVEIYYNLNIIASKLNQLDEANEFQSKYDELAILYPDLDIFKLLVDENKNRHLDVRSKFADKGFIEANVVEIQILNKVTARVYKFTMKIGDELEFENINITPRSCWKTPSQQLPNNYAFFDIMDNQTYEHIFYGWILSSNPSLNSMTHQFYNISLRNCVTKDYK